MGERRTGRTTALRRRVAGPRNGPVLPGRRWSAIPLRCIGERLRLRQSRQLRRSHRPTGRPGVLVRLLQRSTAGRAFPGGLHPCAGLTGLTILKREERPWETVRDVEFRSVTVAARKPASQVSATPPSARRREPFAAVALGTGPHLVCGRAAPLRPQDLLSLLSGPHAGRVHGSRQEAQSGHRFGLIHHADDSTDSPPVCRRA